MDYYVFCRALFYVLLVVLKLGVAVIAGGSDFHVLRLGAKFFPGFDVGFVDGKREFGEDALIKVLFGKNQG